MELSQGWNLGSIWNQDLGQCLELGTGAQESCGSDFSASFSAGWTQLVLALHFWVGFALWKERSRRAGHWNQQLPFAEFALKLFKVEKHFLGDLRQARRPERNQRLQLWPSEATLLTIWQEWKEKQALHGCPSILKVTLALPSFLNSGPDNLVLILAPGC